MEIDYYKGDGNIILNTWDSIRTTDGKTTSILFTDSTNSMKSFKQINTTHVIIVFQNKHCIKAFNRENNKTSDFAGNCGSKGYIEGKPGIGRLNYPQSIEIDVANQSRLLVIDQYNSALRSVELDTGELGTVIQSGFVRPAGMVWAGTKLLVANENYISQVTWLSNGSVTNNMVAGSVRNGYRDGSFQESKFGYPNNLEKVGPGVYVVVDHFNKALRLLDFNEQTVGPVCIYGERPCSTSSKLPNSPLSVLKVRNDVYVGLWRDIYQLSGSYHINIKLKLSFMCGAVP